MSSVTQIMTELKKKGSEQTRKIYRQQGGGDNMFGVKVADLKVIAKQIKGDQEVACGLFETGNFEAMYLAGLVADGTGRPAASQDPMYIMHWPSPTRRGVRLGVCPPA